MKLALLGPYPLDAKNIQGGAHAHIYALTEHFRHYADLYVHVITISPELEDDKTIVKDNITVHYIASKGPFRLLSALTTDRKRIIKKTKEINPDIVHAHCTVSYGFPASSLSKKFPTIMTVHGISSEEIKTFNGLSKYPKWIIETIIERHVLKKIKDIIVVSHYASGKIEPLCRKNKIYIIPVGINRDFFEIKNNEKKGELLFVGGIEPRKGLLYLFKSVKIMKEIIPTIRLHVVGRVRKKGYYNRLRGYVDTNDLTENIRFLGSLDKEGLKMRYSECSVFVLPSQEESLGLVLVEAMAAGKPVVASGIGGIPDVVDNNENGFLVEYGNSKQLAERITVLLNDKNLRETMGTKGREKAKEFKNEVIAKQIYDLYNNILGECIHGKKS
ncbi:MAG: glycosyltransferase family 4 protein [Candidatus Altiarchaeota archaeon]|nr:glycosyltransferase family 4 protein [Candidatus Altiarchaeota archaeon]